MLGPDGRADLGHLPRPGHYLTSAPGRVAVMFVVTVVGASVYFAAQGALQAPQMQWVKGAMLGRRLGGAGGFPRPGARICGTRTDATSTGRRAGTVSNWNFPRP